MVKTEVVAAGFIMGVFFALSFVLALIAFAIQYKPGPELQANHQECITQSEIPR